MLRSLRVRGFKSLADASVELPRFAVLLGPNAVGKSNFLDALQIVSSLATAPTLHEAFGGPLRGYPAEAFSLPGGGLPELLQQPQVDLTLTADVETSAQTNGSSPHARDRRFRYSVTIGLQPSTGALSVHNEYLAECTATWQPGPSRPRIEREGDHLVVRRKGTGRPEHQPIGLNHTQISNRRYTGRLYNEYDLVRSELSKWRHYYLDPGNAMRWPAPPMEVHDIGELGQYLAPYLYWLQQQHRDAFEHLQHVLSTIIPAVSGVTVELDRRRGTLDIQLEQGGIKYSSRVISEGTLRVLALCALAVNPQPPALIAYEEPENGVHPARLQLIARLLVSMSSPQGSQVVVTTHSPLFASTILQLAGETESDVGLFTVSISSGTTTLTRFDVPQPMLQDEEIRRALSHPDERDVLEAMLKRGWLDR
jgi:predicted ATPase